MATQQQSSVLLATDHSASVLRRLGAGVDRVVAYSPFGFFPRGTDGVLSGFNGQVFEALARGYLLGHGYRNFNPALQRFSAPDSLSPFGDGGLNAYVYCSADPQNNSDPSGHAFLPKFIKNIFTARQSTSSMIKDLTFFKRGVKFGETDQVYSIAATKLQKGEKGLDVQVVTATSRTRSVTMNVTDISTGNIKIGTYTRTKTTIEVKLTRLQIKELKTQRLLEVEQDAIIRAVNTAAYRYHQGRGKTNDGDGISRYAEKKKNQKIRYG